MREFIFDSLKWFTALIGVGVIAGVVAGLIAETIEVAHSRRR